MSDRTSRVAILMGSDSDLPVMSETAKILKSADVGFDLHVTSAHRSPERTLKIVRDSEKNGVRVFIAGAGGAAHLAGVVAAHTTLPVLGVPLASSDLKGLDALLATAQMPPGIAVGSLGPGKWGAANAAWLALSILALSDRDLAAHLKQRRKEMAEAVAAKNAAVAEKLSKLL